MRIAVVDDMMAECLNLSDKIERIMRNSNLDCEITTFNNADDFILSAKGQPYELVFMDIYMQPTDGISAAKLLRSFDKECILIFTTSSKDHALEGFQVRAFQYLIKPISDEALKDVFNEVIKFLKPIEKYIEIKSGRQNLRIKLHDILWAENYQHQILIHLYENEIVTTRMTFGTFSSLLQDERFFVCNRGVLINFDYVSDFDGNIFHMTTGEHISVSRDISSKAKSYFAEYLFKHDWEPRI